MSNSTFSGHWAGGSILTVWPHGIIKCCMWYSVLVMSYLWCLEVTYAVTDGFARALRSRMLEAGETRPEQSPPVQNICKKKLYRLPANGKDRHKVDILDIHNLKVWDTEIIINPFNPFNPFKHVVSRYHASRITFIPAKSFNDRSDRLTLAIKDHQGSSPCPHNSAGKHLVRPAWDGNS